LRINNLIPPKYDGRGSEDTTEAGVGGFSGMKKNGTVAAVAITATITN
jgi:hypothetical protein